MSIERYLPAYPRLHGINSAMIQGFPESEGTMFECLEDALNEFEFEWFVKPKNNMNCLVNIHGWWYQGKIDLSAGWNANDPRWLVFYRHWTNCPIQEFWAKPNQIHLFNNDASYIGAYL